MRTAMFVVGLSVSSVVSSAATFQVATDRVAYSGSVSRFASLADAQGGVNAIGNHAIPARNTAAPYNTASRDAGLFFSNDAPVNAAWGLGGDAAVLLSAWYYTTDQSQDRYSGQGNPSNTNVGFVQMYDDNASQVTASDASFGGFDGSFWTTLTLNASGSNADFDNDSSRLWNADGINSFPSVTFGTFVSYDLSITFGGLEGTPVGGGLIEANNHPTSVVGTFSAVFQNTDVGNTFPLAGPDDNAFDGFYRAEFSFNMDSWAFGQGANLVGGVIDPSYFLAVPAPGTAAAFGMGAIVAMKRRRVA